MKCLNFILFLWVIFALLVPDSIRIRIRNTAYPAPYLSINNVLDEISWPKLRTCALNHSSTQQNKKLKIAEPTSTHLILQYLWVPVGRIGKVADELELVQTVQVGENLLGVTQVVGENVVIVPHTLSQVKFIVLSLISLSSSRQSRWGKTFLAWPR